MHLVLQTFSQCRVFAPFASDGFRVVVVRLFITIEFHSVIRSVSFLYIIDEALFTIRFSSFSSFPQVSLLYSFLVLSLSTFVPTYDTLNDLDVSLLPISLHRS